MLSLPPELLDEDFLRWVAEHATPDERARYGTLLKQQAEINQRLSLQPKQQLAEELSQQADELLFGGSAGGGKSWWLITHCIRQMLRYPGNRGIIFRRVYPSLERTIIPRTQALTQGLATYNGQKHTFTFLNGSILEVGSLQYAHSVTDYQGTEYGVIAFEELTEFLDSQLDFMKSRLRSPVDGPHPHLIATTNPGGPGHSFVKRRYVRPKVEDVAAGQALPEPFEIWRPAPTDADPDPLTRCFVPATLKDNPKLTERDPGYLRRLRSLRNKGLRKALEEGDWDAIEAVEGAQWTASQLDYLRVRTAPPMEEFAKVVVGVDPSGGNKKNNDEQGIVAVGKTFDGQGYVLADRSCKLKPKGWARRAVQLAIDVGADVIVVERNFGGDMAVSPLEDAAEELGWNGKIKDVKASRGKRLRAEPVAVLYGDPDDPETWDKAVMHHVGDFEVLEDQQKSWLPEDGVSPDHLDAMVFAATEAFDLNHDGPTHWSDVVLGAA